MIATPSPAHVFTLHRYYLWSTILKARFQDTLAGFTARGERFSLNSDEGVVTQAYMSYWYAALYVVIEGWQKLGLHDDEVDELLASENVELLKLYRHSVFHFHEDYFNRHLTLPFIEGDATVTWVRELSSEFGRWFLAWLDERQDSGTATASDD